MGTIVVRWNKDARLGQEGEKYAASELA